MSEFRFKQTTIQQSEKVFKVGTDAMILGSFMTGDPVRVLDVGCGTGILSLMAAQQFSAAYIHALDINRQAVDLTESNFRNSTWSSRLQVFHQNIYDWKEADYDLVVSNPPFFEEKWKSADENMKLAKHQTGGDLKDWIAACISKVSPEGSVFLILPHDRMNIVKEYVQESGMFLNQVLSVKGKKMLPVKRVVVVLSKEKDEFRENCLIVYDDSGRYTAEFKELTHEFYTMF